MTESAPSILTDESGRWQVSLHPPDDRPLGSAHGSEAIIMIDHARTVLVRGTSGRLNTPGGHPEVGESSEQTMKREVREEACAEVEAAALIGFARSEKLDGNNAGFVMVRDMYVARVRLLPWVQPPSEIAERLIVPLANVPELMRADWPGLDAFSADLVRIATEALPKIHAN